MKALRAVLDRIGHHFEKGGRYERFYPLWEAVDTVLLHAAQGDARRARTCATRSTSSA